MVRPAPRPRVELFSPDEAAGGVNEGPPRSLVEGGVVVEVAVDLAAAHRPPGAADGADDAEGGHGAICSRPADRRDEMKPTRVAAARDRFEGRTGHAEDGVTSEPGSRPAIGRKLAAVREGDGYPLVALITWSAVTTTPSAQAIPVAGNGGGASDGDGEGGFMTASASV